MAMGLFQESCFREERGRLYSFVWYTLYGYSCEHIQLCIAMTASVVHCKKRDIPVVHSTDEKSVYPKLDLEFVMTGNGNANDDICVLDSRDPDEVFTNIVQREVEAWIISWRCSRNCKFASDTVQFSTCFEAPISTATDSYGLIPTFSKTMIVVSSTSILLVHLTPKHLERGCGYLRWLLTILSYVPHFHIMYVS